MYLQEMQKYVNEKITSVLYKNDRLRNISGFSGKRRFPFGKIALKTLHISFFFDIIYIYEVGNKRIALLRQKYLRLKKSRVCGKQCNSEQTAVRGLPLRKKIFPS